jgi:hypothetical protein
VAFALDGHTIATGSADKTVVLSDLADLDGLEADPMERACTLTGHGLDPDQWARDIPELLYQDSCSP